MAWQLKLPVATVARSADKPDVFAVLMVDLTLLAKSKSFAAIKAQAPEWSDLQVTDYLLSMMAQGPV